MWKGLLLVLVVMSVAFAASRAWERVVRRRALAALPAGDLVRVARDVGLRVTLRAVPPLAGLEPGRVHVKTGDLALTSDRFVVVIGSGVLVDVGPGARRLSSARCTGPGRLVLEQQVPRPSGPPGAWRIDVTVPDAEAWADALAPFVEEGAGPRYARKPPGSP